VARGIVVERAVTSDTVLEPFPLTQHTPIPFSTTWILVEIPVLLPQLLPYFS